MSHIHHSCKKRACPHHPGLEKLRDVKKTATKTAQIYGDLPREDIDRLNYPRLMVKVTSGVTKEFALGAGSNITNYMINCQLWSTSIRRLNTGIDDMRNLIINNKKSFYHCPFVTISNIGSMMEDYGRGERIYTRPIDLVGRFVVERVT